MRVNIESHLPHALAMVQPACRTVVVAVYAVRENDGAITVFKPELFPVVALVGQSRFTYSKEVEQGQYSAPRPTHRSMVQGGWRFADYSVHFDALIVDREFGLAEAEECLGLVSNLAWEIVACPWALSEDDDQLAHVVARLTESARQKAQSTTSFVPTRTV